MTTYSRKLDQLEKMLLSKVPNMENKAAALKIEIICTTPSDVPYFLVWKKSCGFYLRNKETNEDVFDNELAIKTLNELPIMSRNSR